MIGVILAGGQSSRMGRDKASVEIAGAAMMEWVHRALSSVCDTVAVCGGPGGIPDPEPGYRGPLAGLVAAFERFPGEAISLTGVDQPWLRPETVSRLGESATQLAVAPVEGGVRQTTCAVYPAALAEIARAELAAGGSLQSLLDVASFLPVVDWHVWGEDGRSWFSVDTADDLSAGVARFGPPPG